MEEEGKKKYWAPKSEKILLNETGMHFRLHWSTEILTKSGCFNPGIFIKQRLTYMPNMKELCDW